MSAGVLTGAPAGAERERMKNEDLTGRDRLVSNVLVGWIAHLVFIIAGFILPRMIDRRLGQELLGIWDFAWSLVSYFGLVQAGISSATNRYVARYWAARDISGVNRIVSSASCVLAVAGMLIFALTIIVSLLLPQWFGTRLGEHVREAQWVVFFLGASVGIEIAFGAYNGVLTGCHRWGLRNIIDSVWHAAVITGMITALLMGKGLRTLSLINLMGTVLAVATRVILAHGVCEGLRFHSSLVWWETIRELFVFGGKAVTLSVSDMLLNQTVNILIAIYLGPAMLAVYARPRSLIGHINVLVTKMAFVLTPTTSSLQSTENPEGIQELLIKSVRYSSYMVLPMVLVLIVFGGAILHLWMGSRYAKGLIPAILAVGYFTTMVQLPVLSICAGLNALGRPAIAYSITSLLTIGLVYLTLGLLEGGLASTAVVVTVPLTVLNAFYMPVYICRKLSLSLKTYFRETMYGPLVCVIPFGICLLTARLIFHTEPFAGLVWGGSVGGVFLSILYWRYVIPDRIKMSLFSFVQRTLKL